MKNTVHNPSLSHPALWAWLARSAIHWSDWRCRQFYRTYPIVNALRSQLNWMQYRMLIQIKDASKREHYELEAVKNGWVGRELKRQINSSLYERLLLGTDKEAVLAMARNEKKH